MDELELKGSVGVCDYGRQSRDIIEEQEGNMEDVSKIGAMLNIYYFLFNSNVFFSIKML